MSGNSGSGSEPPAGWFHSTVGVRLPPSSEALEWPPKDECSWPVVANVNENNLMLQKNIVRAAAWLEIVVGVTLIAIPKLPCQLLLGAPLDGAGVIMSRFAGIGLLALGIAYSSTAVTTPPRGAVLGLFVFNVAAVILFIWVGVATAVHGLLLWPAAILHSGIAAVLLPILLGRTSLKSGPV